MKYVCLIAALVLCVFVTTQAQARLDLKLMTGFGGAGGQPPLAALTGEYYFDDGETARYYIDDSETTPYETED